MLRQPATETIQLATDNRLKPKEWLLIMRLRQAERAGAALVIVELGPELTWRLVGKKEG